MGVSVYLWSVDERNHFLRTNIQEKLSEKNVPNCSSVDLCVGKSKRVITALLCDGKYWILYILSCILYV